MPVRQKLRPGWITGFWALFLFLLNVLICRPLFRTEYLFLTHPDVPDEDEQCAAYRAIVAASPGQQVTIRTLDLGGDKTIPYLARDQEANPFMGWRSIRLSFEHPEFFNHQIRAVLRAAAGG